MIAYKAFFICHGKLVSACARGQWRKEYTPGQVTFPRYGTKLFVFDKLGYAKDFLKGCSEENYQVWRVQCPGIEFCSWIAPAYHTSYWDNYWERLFHGRNLISWEISVPPSGTHTTRWLVPLEQV